MAEKKTLTKKMASKPKTAKPSDLGTGGAARAAEAIRKRKQMLKDLPY